MFFVQQGCGLQPTAWPFARDRGSTAEGMSVTLHTSLGDVKIELFCDTAPRTCFNFLALAASGSYDKTLFHRNMRDFMIQGGDPTGTGKGGQSVWGKKFADEFHADNKHSARGMVSMANSGPNTNKSQFFFTYSKQARLNNVYTVFGRVIDGLDTLDAMERSAVGAKHRPVNDITLKTITIHANPLAEHHIVYMSPDGPPQTVD